MAMVMSNETGYLNGIVHSINVGFKMLYVTRTGESLHISICMHIHVDMPHVRMEYFQHFQTLAKKITHQTAPYSVVGD